MFAEIKQATGNRTSLLAALFVLFVPLSVLMGDFAGAMFIILKQEHVPFILDIFFRLIGIALGAVFFQLAVKRLINNRDNTSATATKATPEGSSTIKSDNQSIASMLNFLFGICIIELLEYIIPPIIKLDLTPAFFGAIAALVVAAFLFVLFLNVSWRLAYEKTDMNGYGRALAKSLKLCLKKPLFLLALIVIIILSIAVGIIIYSHAWEFLKGTAMSASLALFYRYVLLACFIGFVMLFTIKLIDVKNTKADIIKEPQYQSPQYEMPQYQAPQYQSPQYETPQYQAPQYQAMQPPKRGNPLPGLILLALFIIGSIYSVIPVAGSIENEIDEYRADLTAKAEEDRNADRLYLCGTGYKRAFAVSQAFEGYLYNAQAVKDKNVTEKAKAELGAKANAAITNAYTYWPNSGLVYYIDAMRQRESNPSTSITYLEQAIRLSPEWYDSYFELMKLYNANNMKDKSADIADKLIKAGVYNRLRQLDGIGANSAGKLAEQYVAGDVAYMENFATIAISYYENQLYPEAMAELKQLQQVMPENLAVNYLIALTDLEIKQDGKIYEEAIKASQTILKQFPGEQWAQDFATGIAMRAGNQSVMETSLESSYAQYPDNPDISEQYAYSLLRKNTDFSYSEAAQQAETIIDGILAKEPGRWFSLYCKAVIDLLKRDYSGSLEQLSKFSDAMEPETGIFTTYDDFYSLYVYKYEYLMQQDAKAGEALEMIKDTNLFAYNYIYGAYFWKTADYVQGEKFLKDAIYLAPGFSKPYYMLGNVYFEMAGTQNKPEYYAEAEEMYRQALVIFPEDPFAWFSLAHVMKKTERYEEAMGAFQKTLVYMPAEDHNTDHFGVSIHSTIQIQEISALLKQKEGQ